MRKFCFGLFLALLTSFSLAAQSERPQDLLGRAQRMADELGLTEDQRAQIKEIRKAHRKMSREEIESILTEEQLAILETKREDRRNQLPPQLEALDLTDEQRTQLLALRQEADSREDRKANRDKVMAILTEEQRAQLKANRGQGRGRRGGAPRN